MGRGKAYILEDVAEKQMALSLLMKTQTDLNFSFAEKMASVVAIIRIDVQEFTAKHRPIPQK